MTRVGRQLAVLVGSPLGGLVGVEADVQRIGQRLRARGFACRRCVGPLATRARMLGELEALRDAARPGDAVVVYYSGHGGRCHLDGSERAHNYLVPMDHDRERRFRGVADFELALIIHDLSLRTRNVTVILDCCHAATMVRDAHRDASFRSDAGFGPGPNEQVRRWIGQARYPMPDAMKARFDDFQARAGELHPDGNPGVVRLVATGSGSPAFELRDGDRSGGYLTAELCAALDEGLDALVSWDAVTRRLRERIIARRGSTTQRPELEGPVGRLPFTLQTVADVVGRSTLVQRQTDGSAWVRAGRLHGVSLGDELAVLDGRGEGSVVATAEVVERLDDCARVELRCDRETSVGGPATGSVVVISRPALRRSVWLDGEARALAELRGALGRNARLRVIEHEGEAMFRVRGSDGPLRLEGPLLHRIPRRADTPGIARLAHDLDDVVRASILEDALADPPGLPPDLAWSIEVLVRPPGHRSPRPLVEGETLVPGTGVRVRLEHATRAKPTLYVNALDRGVSRRMELLNPSQPSGVPLRAPTGPSPTVEWVPGSTMVMPLGWPADVPKVPGLSEALVFVVSDRPLDLRALLGLDEAARRLHDHRTTAVRPLADTHPDAALGSALRWAVRRASFTVLPEGRPDGAW